MTDFISPAHLAVLEGIISNTLTLNDVRVAVSTAVKICQDLGKVQRFIPGDIVSINGGIIDMDSKRQIESIVKCDNFGGVRYKLAGNKGLAYDLELDPWPEDESILPLTSPRTLADLPYIPK